MAPKAFDVSASGVSDSPPLYDAIYTFASTDSVRCKPSVFSFLQSKQKRRALVLSRIREVVSSPDFTLASVAPIVKSCAAALPAAEFSNLLQEPNIEDHTALYCTIVNNRREALWEFVTFIPKFSSACSFDLRLACMTVNDHDLFMLRMLSAKDRSLRRMLGCPKDDVQIQEGDGVDKDSFFVRFVFRMFQKRLRITHNVEAEFVARGRIWVSRFYMRLTGKWYVEYHLSEKHGSPVHPHAALQIQANKSSPGSDTGDLRFCMRTPHMLVPGFHRNHCVDSDKEATYAVDWQLDDWPMDDDTVYVDCNGTLTARLQITIK